MFHYLTISSRGSPFLVDRPLVVQMAGDDPAIMLAAAKLVEHQCDAFDINLGCPQRIAYTGANDPLPTLAVSPCLYLYTLTITHSHTLLIIAVSHLSR